MKIRLEHGLAYLEVILTFRGRSLSIRDTILDTGSASTIFSADRKEGAERAGPPGARCDPFPPLPAS